MSALYQLSYEGLIGFGHGALYIGKGLLLGSDAGGGRYRGSYKEENGRLVGSLSLIASSASSVAGQPLPSGQVLEIPVDLPLDFADGRYHPMLVGGTHVGIAFAKIGDIP